MSALLKRASSSLSHHPLPGRYRADRGSSTGLLLGISDSTPAQEHTHSINCMRVACSPSRALWGCTSGPKSVGYLSCCGRTGLLCFFTTLAGQQRGEDSPFQTSRLGFSVSHMVLSTGVMTLTSRWLALCGFPARGLQGWRRWQPMPANGTPPLYFPTIPLQTVAQSRPHKTPRPVQSHLRITLLKQPPI